MAYNDDAVLAKLSALNETQESIVTVAQWVMFHRRHADRTGQLWLQRLKDSGSNKRLNLIYLANEVAQQSKARRKDDFLIAFSPVIAEATATAYKGATSDVQNKLRRVVEVWRQRQIFEVPIQEAIESRIDELDKSRSSSAKRGGSSIFSPNANDFPRELSPLLAPQQALSKLILSTMTSTKAATQDYEKLTDPNTAISSAPVHAARLNGLLKTLANAEGAVAESIKARQILIHGLEKILDTNRTALAAEEAQVAEIASRKVEIDNKKREVEEAIMRGLSSNSNPTTPAADGAPTVQSLPVTTASEPDRPEIEPLSPPTFPHATDPLIADFKPDQVFPPEDYANLSLTPPAIGSDLLSSLSTSNSYGLAPAIGSAKKRKMESNEDFPDLGGDVMDGLDDDVAAMLRQDTASFS
ncbi:Bgt-4897 [Blumeria graminis f. sp. tritici]|uniref:Bgt-4897 n=2 Tax=Blumeria graminis f. sp. tritici TaxID=62690 RepID=A0A9X9MQ39_BLUGR|nr:hypothetical protein BGT96224_4897 [Blumeria graminis f. sp. tritici 96224]VDB96330.1 Bgt-4897 [Blumeria graminis f. sp. tritici]